MTLHAQPMRGTSLTHCAETLGTVTLLLGLIPSLVFYYTKFLHSFAKTCLWLLFFSPPLPVPLAHMVLSQ